MCFVLRVFIVAAAFSFTLIFGGEARADDVVQIEGLSELGELRRGEERDVHLGIFIRAPEPRPSVRREPIAVSLAIDISGSMHGEKIANARLAALRFLDALREDDQIALIVFNDSVSTLAPMSKLSPARREALRRAISALGPSGGTNLYGGLRAGIDETARADAGARRVILISDGQGNVGPSDVHSLGRLASDGNERHVQVSAIGVGVDYDEAALSAIAIRSAGRYTHLRNPSLLASIVEAELSRLNETVATEIILEIRPRPGVILEPITPGIERDGERLRIPIGALSGGQQRELLVRARLSGQANNEANDEANSKRAIAEVRLEGKSAGGARLNQRSTIDAELKKRPSERRRPEIVALIEEHRAAEAELRAAEALSRGELEAARRALDEGAEAARSALSAAPSSAARSRLSRKSTELKSRAARVSQPSARGEARAIELETRDSALESYGY